MLCGNSSSTIGCKFGSNANSATTMHVIGTCMQTLLYYIDAGSLTTNEGQFIGESVSIIREKINALNTFNIKNIGYDSNVNIERFRIAGDLSIGIDGSGNSLQVGRGTSYTRNTSCISYDGSTYTDISSSDPIQFANTSVNTALYFGNTNEYNWYGLHYLLDQAIVLGEGSIIWEYYNGSWTTVQVMETLSGYSDTRKNATFGGTITNSYTIRFNQSMEDDWVATEIDSINAKWIRCRIVSGITTTMQLSGDSNSRFHLCGSYSEIRSNGTISFHGAARGRVSEIQPYTAGASASNQSLPISSHITYPATDNLFEYNRDDETFVSFRLCHKMDTSCGLAVNFEGYGSQNGGGSDTMVLKYYLSVVPASGLYNGANTEVSYTYSHDMSTYVTPTQIRADTQAFDVSGYKRGDIVFVKIYRTGSTARDTYGSNRNGNFIISKLYFKYHAWQTSAYDYPT